MARDPLRILLSVRRHAVEQARIALGACLRDEVSAVEQIEVLDAATGRDRAVQAAWVEGHRFLEMSALRGEALRAKRRDLAATLVVAEARSGEARALVTAARLAAEAVEQLRGERDAAAEAEAMKRAQHALDDITRVRRAGGQRVAPGLERLGCGGQSN